MIFKVFLRLRPKCKNEWDFWMIMLSFSLAGMVIMPVRKFIFHMVGITPQTPLWITVPVYIALIPPTYYVGLIIFGTLLGQFTFFWGFISKRLQFLTGRKKITN
ncbi:MAG: prolipoprotein diacylglyceryl transferase [Candidatus Omnitrophica bacterium]|nr:prolipoprotein diacylglyceryl transferase [Candidatus Omnitrophota bacterium]